MARGIRKRRGACRKKKGGGGRELVFDSVGVHIHKGSLRNFVQMAGAECEHNKGPNTGTCPVIKDSAQRESFVRQQHHSPPGLTPECRAVL